MSTENIERIDVSSDQALTKWAQKFNATAEQIRDAVA